MIITIYIDSISKQCSIIIACLPDDLEFDEGFTTSEKQTMSKNYEIVKKDIHEIDYKFNIPEETSIFVMRGIDIGDVHASFNGLDESRFAAGLIIYEYSEILISSEFLLNPMGSPKFTYNHTYFPGSMAPPQKYTLFGVVIHEVGHLHGYYNYAVSYSAINFAERENYAINFANIYRVANGMFTRDRALVWPWQYGGLFHKDKLNLKD